MVRLQKISYELFVYHQRRSSFFKNYSSFFKFLPVNPLGTLYIVHKLSFRKQEEKYSPNILQTG